MIAVAMLQNGQMPAFIEDHILQEILSPNKSLNPCVSEMQAGLEKLGMLSALRQLPMFIHLLRPGSQHKVTVPRLLEILKPKFAEEGSNAVKYQKEVYQMFVRYVREDGHVGRLILSYVTFWSLSQVHQKCQFLDLE